MLQYRSERRFHFKSMDYLSDSFLILKDEIHQKEDLERLIPPAHLYNVYKHDKLDPIGKAKFAIIDNADEVPQGLVTFRIGNKENQSMYAYHICMLLKQLARSYDMDTIYYLPDENYDFTEEEKEKLHAEVFLEDGTTYYKMKVEKI